MLRSSYWNKIQTGASILSLLYLPQVLCCSSSLSSASKASTPTMSSQAPLPSPPVAKKVEHKMEMFGDVRVDNYYWLRDDSRSDPEMLAYLKQENEYFDAIMCGMVHFYVKDSIFFCCVNHLLCYQLINFLFFMYLRSRVFFFYHLMATTLYMLWDCFVCWNDILILNCFC